MRYSALYGRQSLDVKDSLSVSMQLEKARAMCEPGETYKEYIDKGFSGKNTNRPGFIRLMQDIEDGLIKRVIVYKLDRFSRSVLDFCEAWEVMEKHHVEFMSVNEKFDTGTPMGKAMLLILMVFAQMERETISERVTDNYYTRAKYGSWLGGPAPYGMDLCRITDISGKKIPSLQYNEFFTYLERSFYDYAEERFISLGAIARKLQEEGVEPPGGIAWNNVTLSRLFRNPVYVKADADVYTYYKAQGVELLQPLEEFDGTHAGMVISKRSAKTRTRTKMEGWKFTLANWPGRIPSDIWLTCQAKLKSNQQLQRSGSGKNSWLSGIIKCGFCGKALVLTSYKQKRYFHCSGRRSGICAGERGTIYAEVIEDIVASELQKVIEKCVDEPFEEVSEENQQDKIELAKIEERIENLMNFIADGQVTGAAVKLVNEELSKLYERQAQIREAQITQKTRRRRVLTERLEFDKLTLEQKKLVASGYLEKVLVYEEESVEIIWNI